ncbi:MAG TPA: helix-turn-helix domain-containing protein [Solirubrobacterales bacterium]
MTTRTYNDLCGIARALDVVGERWAILVVRELVLGPKRFTDLRAGLRGIGPDMLSARLRDLEAAGVVARRSLGPPAGAKVYELTQRGRALEPVLLELGRWGSVVPPPSATAELGVDSAVLALPSLFDAEAAGDLEESYGLRLDGQDFEVRIAGGAIGTDRGEPGSPVAKLATDPGTFAALLWQGLDLTAAEAAGSAAVEGDRRAAKRFLGLFPLPG